MVKKLTKHGNSLALVIDRPILELLRIDPMKHRSMSALLTAGFSGTHSFVDPDGPDRRVWNRRL
jgi:hypothetical protein